MKRVIILMAASVFLLAGIAKADVLDSPVQIQFMPEINSLSITTDSHMYYGKGSNISDRDKDAAKEKYGLYSLMDLATPDEKGMKWALHNLDKTFEANGKKMRIVVTPIPLNANPNGRCGALVDADLTFIVNDKTLLDKCPLVINRCEQSDKMYKAQVAKSDCLKGIYYNFGADMLAMQNHSYFDVSTKGIQKSKKHE